MGKRQSRKAHEQLKRRFSGGGLGERGPARVRKVELAIPESIVVGKRFAIRITTDPTFTGFVQVTADKKSQYVLKPEPLRAGELLQDEAFAETGIGWKLIPKGVYFAAYGTSRVINGRGTVQATVYSRNRFTVYAEAVDAKGPRAKCVVSEEMVRRPSVQGRHSVNLDALL